MYVVWLSNPALRLPDTNKRLIDHTSTVKRDMIVIMMYTSLKLLRYTDGSRTWSKWPHPSPSPPLRSFSFPSFSLFYLSPISPILPSPLLSFPSLRPARRSGERCSPGRQYLSIFTPENTPDDNRFSNNVYYRSMTCTINCPMPISPCKILCRLGGGACAIDGPDRRTAGSVPLDPPVLCYNTDTGTRFKDLSASRQSGTDDWEASRPTCWCWTQDSTLAGLLNETNKKLSYRWQTARRV